MGLNIAIYIKAYINFFPFWNLFTVYPISDTAKTFKPNKPEIGLKFASPPEVAPDEVFMSCGSQRLDKVMTESRLPKNNPSQFQSGPPQPKFDYLTNSER